jgi:SAM-dependent methyltransferase
MGARGGGLMLQETVASRTPVCRLCGSSDATLVSATVSEAPESAVYSCSGCGIVYVFPIMSEVEEASFYARQFEEYMARRSGPGWKSPETHFESYRPEGERRVPLVIPHVRPGDALLEIGSSTGFFLEAIRERVATVTGVEPSEAYRAYASSRGIETVEDLEGLGARRFDVIALYYVVEHLRDPVGYAASMRGRLNKGGRLLIEVPNVDDALLSLYRIPAFSDFYWQRAHYHNFSRHTLRSVLERAGYRVNTFPVQRYDLSNHLVWMKEGKPGGAGRYAGVLGEEVDAAYRRTLMAQWICDTVFAVAMKD